MHASFIGMTSVAAFRPGLWLTQLQLAEFEVRGAVIVGSDRSIVWDTLSHPRDMRAVAQLISGRAHTVVYSHADWDHCWGTAGLAKRQTVIGHTDCLQRFKSDVPRELLEKQIAEPGEWDAVELIPPDQTLQKYLSLQLGGLTLELHHLPGHTLDCLVGFIPEWKILLAGDTMETPLPVVNEESPVAEWIAGLQRWANDERVQTVIPAHGIIAGREIIQYNIAYLQKLWSGAADESLPGLSAFYSETHAENLQIVHARRDVT